jgi:geranylgeranylglycerol-phosphate geranylgeranyltransferase
MKEYIEIIRPSIVFMSALGVIIGAIISGAKDFFILIAALSAFLIAGAGVVVNDIYDYETDKINFPNRPLPSKRMKKSIAAIYSVILFFIGISLSYLINIYCFLLAILNSFLEIIYARNLKRIALLGNALDSWFVASTFIFGYFSSLRTAFIIKESFASIILVSLLAFLSNMGREIFGDIDDIKGDKKARMKTLPIITSERFAKYVASIFIILAVILSPLPFLLGFFSFVYLLIVFVADILFLYSLFKDPKTNQKITKIAMIIALLAFLFGSLF